MNKSELIDQIAKSADLSKAAAGRALDATIAAVKTSLKKGGMVNYQEVMVKKGGNYD